MGKRVIIFGSSSNPPTGMEGHMGIVSYFSNLFDEVWILPVYRHAYSSKRNLESFEMRLAMLELSLQDCSLSGKNIFVKEYEKDCLYDLYPEYGKSIETVNYGTIDLVRWLRRKFPDVDFSMIVGEDAFMDILDDKWRESPALRESIHFEVLYRKGLTASSERQDGEWYSFHDLNMLGAVSSTQARASTDVNCLEKIVTPSVATYIRNNHLYAFSPTM